MLNRPRISTRQSKIEEDQHTSDPLRRWTIKSSSTTRLGNVRDIGRISTGSAKIKEDHCTPNPKNARCAINEEETEVSCNTLIQLSNALLFKVSHGSSLYFMITLTLRYAPYT